MKKLLLLLTLTMGNYRLQAQCTVPLSSIDIHGNNILARIQNGGDLFTDFFQAQFVPNPNPNPGIPSPATIAAAGIWMGGVDAQGKLRMAAADHRHAGGTDFAPGPLNDNGTTDAFNCSNWDRHFWVTGDEINTFLHSLPMTKTTAIALFRGIMGWPGKGNPYFKDIWGFDYTVTTNNHELAPFFDHDGDGLYDPLNGDYPVVALRDCKPFVPAEMVWCVFNDQKGGAFHVTTGASPLQMEVQLTAWAFNCPNEPVLNNTLYTAHKLIHRATETIDSFFVGLWVDYDLGCYQDDYVGCSPGHNTMFAYNQDAVDGTPGGNCNGIATFGNNPPIQTVTFLGSDNKTPFSLDKFMAYNNSGAIPGAADPMTAAQYYNNLTGRWRDGKPFTQGGSGYNGATKTSYLFPGDPGVPGEWSMCTAGLVNTDQRVLGSHKVGTLLPGQIVELTTAWTVHENIPQPCNLGNTFDQVDMLRALHNNQYASVCSPLLKAPEYPADSLDLFPNPTAGDATLRYGSIRVDELRIFDATGKLVQTLTKLQKGETRLKTDQLPAGVYTLQIFSDHGVTTKKLAVLR